MNNALNSVINSFMKMTNSEEVKAQIFKIKLRVNIALRHLLFHMKKHMTKGINVYKAVNSSIRLINKLIKEHFNYRTVISFYYFSFVKLLRLVK